MLDPLLLNNPEIGKHIQHLRFTNKTNDYERVSAAIHKFAVTDYSEVEDARKNSKVQLAAIIQALSQFAGKRLTSTRITKLYNAYSKDKQRGDTYPALEQSVSETGQEIKFCCPRTLPDFMESLGQLNPKEIS